MTSSPAQPGAHEVTFILLYLLYRPGSTDNEATNSPHRVVAMLWASRPKGEMHLPTFNKCELRRNLTAFWADFRLNYVTMLRRNINNTRVMPCESVKVAMEMGRFRL